MFDYTVFGLKLRTDLEFLQLVPDCTDREPDIFIQVGPIPDFVLEHDNESIASIHMETGWLVNKTMRMIIEGGKTITYSLKPGKSEIYLRAYLLGYGLSMLCLQRGLLAIHCSALVIGQKAYLVSGESGSGKSTLSGNLLKETDTFFLADDMTIVYKDADGIVYVEPAFPYQKLCRDAALAQGHALEDLIYVDEDKDKFLVPCKEQFYTKRAPLGGMLYLYSHHGSDVKCTNAEGLQLFQLCANNLFLRHLLGPQKFEPHIGQKCLEVASGMKACVIGRPKDRDTTEEIMNLAQQFIRKTV